MLLPISVPVFNPLGSPLTTSVDFAVLALLDGTYFDFSSRYGGSGDDTFKAYASANSPRISLSKLDAANLDGYYGIVLSGDTVPLDLDKFPNGDYLLAAEALSVSPKGRYVNQIGVLNGRLAETIATLLTGDGITQVTIVVKTTGGIVVPNVTVVVRNSLDALVAYQTTNILGEAIFNLAPGTYKVYLNRVGSTDVYTNPYSVAVSYTAMRVELYGTPGGGDMPVPPGTTRVYGYVSDALGVEPRAGIQVRLWVEYPDEAYTTGGIIITGRKAVVLTNDDGYFHFDVIPQKYLTPQGVIYRLEIHESDFEVDIAANLLDAGGSMSLADLGAY